MKSTDQMFVRSVIDSCWSDDGLSDDGQSLHEALRFALRNSGCDDAVMAQASRMASAAASLRKAGRVPVILRYSAKVTA